MEQLTKPHTNIDVVETDEDSGRSRAPFVAIILLALAGLAVWNFMIREVTPASVDVAEAAEARSEAIAASNRSDSSTTQGIDGLWSVDTSIGQFNEACLTDVCSGTFAGFRIDEVLTGIGDKTVVGRTPGVTGQIAIEGTEVTGAEFVADMTGLVTDSGARTSAMRNGSIETNQFPRATFVLRERLDFGQVQDGQPVTVSAPGELTVHGVTQQVAVPLTASLESGVIVVTGQLELALSDFGIDTPSAILELQLFFTR